MAGCSMHVYPIHLQSEMKASWHLGPVHVSFYQKKRSLWDVPINASLRPPLRMVNNDHIYILQCQLQRQIQNAKDARLIVLSLSSREIRTANVDVFVSDFKSTNFRDVIRLAQNPDRKVLQIESSALIKAISFFSKESLIKDWFPLDNPIRG